MDTLQSFRKVVVIGDRVTALVWLQEPREFFPQGLQQGIKMRFEDAGQDRLDRCGVGDMSNEVAQR